MQEFVQESEDKMKKSFDNMISSFSRIRTGRASTTTLDNIKINYYNTLTPVKQLGNINIPEPRLITIQPYDATTLNEIERAILAANIGITPENDGKIIRLPIPALTEEKRKEIAKQIRKIGEDTKVAVRNIRRDGNEDVKKLKKTSEITEDQEKKILEEIQKATDKWIEKIDDVTKNKEKEVLSV